MNYFNGCNTLDEAKTLFRKLAHQLHPDKGGKSSDYIEMRSQFENLKLKPKFESAEPFNFKQFEAQIFAFRDIENVELDFVGSFIWLNDVVKGATYHQRGKITSIIIEGYNEAKFASSKKKWYFSPKGYKKKSRKNFKLNEIKGLYGCQSYKKEAVKRLK